MGEEGSHEVALPMLYRGELAFLFFMQGPLLY